MLSRLRPTSKWLIFSPPAIKLWFMMCARCAAAARIVPSQIVIIIRIEWNSSPLVSSTTILRGGALVRLLSSFSFQSHHRERETTPPSWVPQTEDRKRYRLTHVCLAYPRETHRKRNTIITLEIFERRNAKWLTKHGLQRSSKGIQGVDNLVT